MSKLTLHLQYEPGWLPNFVNRCQGKLKYIKGVNCYPNIDGVRTIGRVFIDDNLSNELVLQGEAGVDQWIYLCRGEYEKAKHVWAWQGPNEFIIDDFGKAARFNEFHVAFIVRMASLGLRVMAGNINTGWPRLQKFGDPLPHPPALRPTIEALVQHDGILSLHEYGPGDMRTGQGAHCLRYRNTVEAWQNAGIPTPRIFTGEAGIDVPDPAFPLDHHHRGWTEWTIASGYLEQLRWYAGELAQDDYILGAAIFTVCNWDWVTFNVDRDLAMGVADLVAWEPDITPTVIPPVPPVPPVPPAHGIIDMVDKLKVRTPTKAIIHHSAGRQRPAKVRRHIQAIARYHVQRLGWPTIGYHYIIDADGHIYRTNRPQVASYHSGDRATNLESYGICMLGDFRTYDPTPQQLDACRWLVCESLQISEVLAHKDIVQTSCPGRWGRWGERITG